MPGSASITPSAPVPAGVAAPGVSGLRLPRFGKIGSFTPREGGELKLVASEALAGLEAAVKREVAVLKGICKYETVHH